MMRGLALSAAVVTGFLASACGTHDDSETLSDRLQGQWSCQLTYPDQGFIRTDYATLAVYPTTLQYTVNSAWECDSAVACPGDPPTTRGGYFEGYFKDLGDSLVLVDGVDTVAFRSVTDTSFTFIVNATAFPMRRN